MKKEDFELMKYASEASMVNDTLNNFIRKIQSDAYDRGYFDRGCQLDEAYERGYDDAQAESGAAAAYESGYNNGYSDAKFQFKCDGGPGYDDGYLRGYADALQMVSDMKK